MSSTTTFTRFCGSPIARGRIALAAAAVLAITPFAQAERLFPAWSNLYESQLARSQWVRDTAVDSRGNVILCGERVEADGTKKSFFVGKFDGLTGAPMWEGGLFIFPAANGNSSAVSVAVD